MDNLLPAIQRFKTIYKKKDNRENNQGFTVRHKKQMPAVFTIIPVSGYPLTLTHSVNCVPVSYPSGKDSELL
jgi:hypothetical protein